MHHIFLVQVGHAQRDIFAEAEKKVLRQLLLLLMKIVEKTATR